MEAIIQGITPSALLAGHYGLASPKDRRTQLTGYHFTKRAGVVYMVATDGHILIIQRLPDASMDADTLTIIPASKPAAGIAKASTASIYQLDDSTALIQAGSVALSAKIYTASAYPNVEQVWGQTMRNYQQATEAAADFDPALLNTLQRSAKAACTGRGQPAIKIHQRGHCAALVTSSIDDWAAVIMPMRSSELPPPSWVSEI